MSSTALDASDVCRKVNQTKTEHYTDYITDFCRLPSINRDKSGVRSHPRGWLSSISLSGRRSIQPLKERSVFVIKGRIVYTVFHDSFLYPILLSTVGHEEGLTLA